MKRFEAIAPLARCVPLANRLAAQGVNISLDQADLAALEGFNRVYVYNEGLWLEEKQVVWQTGLQPGDVNTLGFMLAKVQAGNMRQQHENGEQLDG